MSDSRPEERKEIKTEKSFSDSEAFTNELKNVLTEIFRKNVREDDGFGSAMQIHSFTASQNDDKLEWKMEYSTKKVREYASRSLGSHGRYIFLKDLEEMKKNQKMDIEILDRSHITVRSNHEKFLECLQNSIPKIYKLYQAKWSGKKSELEAEQKSMTSRCQILIDNFAAYQEHMNKSKIKSTPSRPA